MSFLVEKYSVNAAQCHGCKTGAGRSNGVFDGRIQC